MNVMHAFRAWYQTQTGQLLTVSQVLESVQIGSWPDGVVRLERYALPGSPPTLDALAAYEAAGAALALADAVNPANWPREERARWEVLLDWVNQAIEQINTLRALHSLAPLPKKTAADAAAAMKAKL